LGKLSDWGSISNDERLQLSRNIWGNLMAIVSYQLIGQRIRNLMIYSAYQGFMALIANSGDLNDDEEKALEEVLTATRDDLITRNNENSWDYMLEDLLFGGIAQQYTGPWVEAIKQLLSIVGIG